MHILVLPSWYPSETDPVSGSFFREQARALARSGHRVSVFSRFWDAPKGYRVDIRRDGTFTEYNIHYKLLRFHLSFFYVLWIMARLLRTELKNDRPDIIHVHSVGSGRYARGLKRLFGIPYVITEHSSWIKRSRLTGRDTRTLEKDYSAAAALIAVSDGLRRRMEPYADKGVRVIPNMADPRFFEGEPTSPGEGTFRFLFVGGLIPVKGVDALLRAFAAVSPGAELVICGDGPERPALEALAGELGIEDRVFFRGQVSREQCAEEMRLCHALVLPSRSETFGMVCAEAMACGRPVITTKTDAWESFITPDTGIAVEIDDMDALRQAMDTLRRDYGKYDPRFIREYCRERFSAEAVCAELTKVYQGVCG